MHGIRVAHLSMEVAMPESPAAATVPVFHFVHAVNRLRAPPLVWMTDGPTAVWDKRRCPLPGW